MSNLSLTRRGLLSEEQNSKKISLFPALPAIVNELLEQLSSRTVTEYQIIALIEGEEEMATSLLKIVNQAFFGETRLSTVSEIVDMLGLPRMRYLILAYGFNRFCKQNYSAHNHTAGLSAKITIEHAISVAYIALQLAKLIKYPRLEEVLLAGLMHDIGRQVIMLNLPGEYGELLGSVYGQVVDIINQERIRIGMSHDQAGVLLAGHWQLPDSITAVIENHHNCEAASDHQTLVHLISLANQIAVAEGTSFERSEPVNRENNISLYFLEISSDDIDKIVKSFRKNISSFRAAF